MSRRLKKPSRVPGGGRNSKMVGCVNAFFSSTNASCCLYPCSLSAQQLPERLSNFSNGGWKFPQLILSILLSSVTFSGRSSSCIALVLSGSALIPFLSTMCPRNFIPLEKSLRIRRDEQVPIAASPSGIRSEFAPDFGVELSVFASTRDDFKVNKWRFRLVFAVGQRRNLFLFAWCSLLLRGVEKSWIPRNSLFVSCVRTLTSKIYRQL